MQWSCHQRQHLMLIILGHPMWNIPGDGFQSGHFTRSSPQGTMMPLSLVPEEIALTPPKTERAHKRPSYVGEVSNSSNRKVESNRYLVKLAGLRAAHYAFLQVLNPAFPAIHFTTCLFYNRRIWVLGQNESFWWTLPRHTVEWKEQWRPEDATLKHNVGQTGNMWRATWFPPQQ